MPLNPINRTLNPKPMASVPRQGESGRDLLKDRSEKKAQITELNPFMGGMLGDIGAIERV